LAFEGRHNVRGLETHAQAERLAQGMIRKATSVRGGDLRRNES